MSVDVNAAENLATTLSALPAPVDPAVTDWLAGFAASHVSGSFDATSLLGPIFSCSDHLWILAQLHQEWLAEALLRPVEASVSAIVADLATGISAQTDLAGTATALRRAKGQASLLLGVAEAGKAIGTKEASRLLSEFADAVIDAALAAALFEEGVSIEPGKCGLAIFAMGKQGGFELNYSSDVDLVCFFEVQKAAAPAEIEPAIFYTRVVRKLVGLLDERTNDGFVFRVDMRLRPDPGATPVAISTDAALAYYESRGQNWERAAWIKARTCAGDHRVGAGFLSELVPFIWRKHLDFATITDIQAMKRQINVARNIGEIGVAGHNVKLGRGGIREIEFFAQTQQLIAGGRDLSLRARSTVEALGQLEETGWLEGETGHALAKAYWFLRSVENRLQMVANEQTHVLPIDETALTRIAHFCGYENLPQFESAYRQVLTKVSESYSELFVDGATLANEIGDLVFTGTDDDDNTLDTLQRLGFEDAAKASATIRKWHYGGYAATRSSAARANLTELLPSLLQTFSATQNADIALARFDDFLSRFPAGVQLFTLLRGHANLSAMLVAFMASAPRMADAVIQRAHVMDGLLDPAFAEGVTNPDVLVEKVSDYLSEARSYEEVIDRARIIGQEQKFLIAAGLISGTVSAEQSGVQFTTLAETLLGHLFEFVKAAFVEQHGTIDGASIGLLAFGKLASREMTFASDLDFILLYDLAEPDAVSNGARPLEAATYFARLTQRLVSALSAPTAEGVLYETDMRLRPSGNAGPLASSLSAFELYQLNKAWTWEHLALTRARVICAGSPMADKIDAIIAKVIGQSHDAAKVIDDVVTMRKLMQKERPPRHEFDVKLMAGGMIDVEFIAQTAQILYREEIAAPGATPKETIRALGALGLLENSDRLLEIQQVFSVILHFTSACLRNPFDNDEWTTAFRKLLAQAANYPDFERFKLDVTGLANEVNAIAADWFEKVRGT